MRVASVPRCVPRNRGYRRSALRTPPTLGEGAADRPGRVTPGGLTNGEGLFVEFADESGAFV